MSGKGKKKKWNKPQNQDGGNKKTPSKYAAVFEKYREEIDANNDKYERLVKLSRDCTIHSKRAIFTLHQFSGEEDKRSTILSEAEEKFNTDIFPILGKIALELVGEDPRKHHRAYSIGIQEFIEAISYYKYLKTGRLISLDEVQAYVTFQPRKGKEVELNEEEKEDVEKDSCKDVPESEVITIMDIKTATSTADVSDLKKIALPLSASDFILGLADLTGELMRLCINSIGSGNRELPFTLVPFFRALFCGFHGIAPGIKYMNQKMNVLRTSLGKVENVCYTLTVRGSEIPKHLITDMVSSSEPMDD